jgi:hypothetical protein
MMAPTGHPVRRALASDPRRPSGERLPGVEARAPLAEITLLKGDKEKTVEAPLT